MIGYSEDIEQKMQRLFGRLSEKDCRCYAAIEAAKLGHGGIKYVSFVGLGKMVEASKNHLQ